jgi:hypothetical protein
MEVNLVPTHESRFGDLQPSSKIQMSEITPQIQNFDPPASTSDQDFSDPDSDFDNDSPDPNKYTKYPQTP